VNYFKAHFTDFIAKLLRAINGIEILRQLDVTPLKMELKNTETCQGFNF
jgi:hypothetical protein